MEESASPRQDSDPGGDQELSRLRQLLLGYEQSCIGELRRRLDDPAIRAEEVGNVLPQAVQQGVQRGPALASAASPLVEEGLRASIRRDPRIVVDVLFPVIGPLIRKVVANALHGMVESFNQVLEQSLTWYGLKWRLEAIRTGKPIAEVALLHSLVYRVEQLFLIHKDSGLLILHVGDTQREGGREVVSGLLTAIQDFVRDSFVTKPGEELETMRVGQLSVWLERGPHAVLATVIRGTAPPALRSRLQDALSNIHFEQGEALRQFQGDLSPFETGRPYLEECLRSEFRAQASRRGLVPVYVVLGVIVLGTVLWGLSIMRSNQRFSQYLRKLEAQPGVVVVGSGKQSGKFWVSGLRDPQALDPRRLLEDSGLHSEEVKFQWRPYLSLDPPLTLARAKNRLQPPDTVVLQVRGSTLMASGEARGGWIDKAQRLALELPGVSEFRGDQVKNLDAEGLRRHKDRIEAARVSFGPGQSTLERSQRRVLEGLVPQIKELLLLGETMAQDIRIRVLGSADSSGPETQNRELRRRRSLAVVRFLTSRGLPNSHLVTAASAGSGPLSKTSEPSVAGSSGRRVIFQVLISQDPVVAKVANP